MATRHLKRLQEQVQQRQPEEEEVSDDEEEEDQPSSAPFNPFDLLSDEEVGR